VSSGDAMSDETMMWDEVADIGALLHELDDEAFDTPSLCDDWEVTDVLGRMGLGHTIPMPAMLARIGRYAFNLTKASFIESKTLFAGKDADEIRRFWDEVMVAQHPKRGISKLIPAKSGFLNHLVHNQDIRRPTGKLRTIPEARLHRALQLVRAAASPLFNSKRNVSGLKLCASGIGWTAGGGPGVQGPGGRHLAAGLFRGAAAAALS
jgi:uncharacterized protein (TIGR03083 family)